MSAAGWIVVIIVVVVVAAGAATVGARVRERRQLQKRFGPEYERVVAEEGDRRVAERRLAEVAKTRDALDVRDLSDGERSDFAAKWQSVQSEFVDQPAAAARHADELIVEVMRTRGYPAADDVTRDDLLAADHPHLMPQYRQAEELRAANASAGDTTGSDTEALRAAVVRYRALFEQLIGARPKDAVAKPAPAAVPDADAIPETAVPAARGGNDAGSR